MDEPTQQLPGPPQPGPPQPGLPQPARPSRRRSRALVLTAAFGTLLVAGLIAAVLAATGDRADTASTADGGLDLLFAPAVAPNDPSGGADTADRPGRSGRPWRHGPLRLHEGERVVAGTVASVGEGSLVVRTDNGAEVTVRTDNHTKVRGNGNRALTDLQAGERVIVKAGSDGTADGVLAVRAHAAGTVTRLDGDRATVVSPGGLTRELDLSGVSERPAVGTAIVAVGSASDGGATLKVEQLRELPTIG